MPYRDPEKRKAAVKKSHEKIYLTTITIKIRNDDKELYKRLISECEKLEVSPTTFIREVIREKLGLPPREPND